MNGAVVPRDATLTWLMSHASWDWFDVLHLHHLDFEPIQSVCAVLAKCDLLGKRVVFTAHDLAPIFGDVEEHRLRLETLVRHSVRFACLTPRSEGEVRRRFPGAPTTFIPHGYVAAPAKQIPVTRRRGEPTRFLLYGSLRANRDVELLLACWRFSRYLTNTTLHLLLRAPSRVSLLEDADAWRAIRDHAMDSRLRVDVLPFPTDADVNYAVAHSDCLLLPYRWASHSGQLEHALDLGVLPLAARTGYLPDQVELHGELVPEPAWFNWQDDTPFDHGARFLTAMQNSHDAIQSGWEARNIERFSDHRRHEHLSILSSYFELYSD